MQTVLIVIHLMIVLALVGVVLIQRSEGGGLGIGGGSGFMSARGTANALTRTTAILATLFFLTSLGLGILTRYEGRPSDILDRIPATGGQGNGILDSLGGAQAPANQPAGNGVPSSGAATPAPQAPAAQAPATGTQAPAASAPSTTAPATPAAPAAPAPAQPSGVPTGQ
ncbi:preprotein translocase subunit SecG [Rhizobium ruizarguesonis]|jgi:preprotein translocase subunit SecG|uniref:preprotein translocase subunit SecG n=1 Tax=Rhizobium ruizarguesonis TaxID=2081791 RepID=UPI0003782C98|nr:preprotein translocase subunit SecG [Rhizobium ruizarguesonis]MBY5833075.1 preprotein translocase subunit SecG [Rhizobium leguminosarum]QJS27770.1 preprotein translocase subunit SecG [Rhizobium leguminosarum bv. trifolii TA1]QND20171.1 preprotein translocase subunit SecG [Rhizobium leguminosarum bv. viciae]MBY5858319.1 preprotein translocase subunit SecG [Rhizobium leguminosarum]MBY5874320.1 preprotein translocase subunit SecG [Rhizobium leguminosarum]